MIRILPTALLAALLTGCVATGVNVSDDQISRFTNGQTSRSEVVAALGKPTTTMRQADGTTMLVYNYVEARARPATYIPIVGAFIGGADSKSNMVTLRFDANDKLIEHTAASSEYGTGMGAAAGSIEPVPNQPRK